MPTRSHEWVTLREKYYSAFPSFGCGYVEVPICIERLRGLSTTGLMGMRTMASPTNGRLSWPTRPRTYPITEYFDRQAGHSIVGFDCAHYYNVPADSEPAALMTKCEVIAEELASLAGETGMLAHLLYVEKQRDDIFIAVTK